jgi:ribosomal protein S7
MNQQAMENFCNANNIVVGSLLIIKVDKRKNCIGLFVENIDVDTPEVRARQTQISRLA